MDYYAIEVVGKLAMIYKVKITLVLTLSIIATTTTQAEPLGRLFFTPEERIKIEKTKRGISEEAPATAAVIAPPKSINGFVKRSDGQTTLWKGGEMEISNKSLKSDIRPKDVQTPNGIIAVPSRQYPLKHELPP